MSTPPSPQTIGDYELLEPIGKGGMGSVFRARQRMLDREVALKLLPHDLARDRAFIERFYNEARATAKLNHPHIVAGIDVGEADGHYYFAMELVEGTSLKQMIERFKALPEKQVLEIGVAIAEALAHAHAAGIIHRDVKPDNILLDRDGVPKLADLGLARAHAENASLTTTGTAVGTPHYIAPEQAEGSPRIDGRADAYALGCTLYHAATGNTPFNGENAAVVMVKHLNSRMPHPQSIRGKLSDGFCDVLAMMVARHPDDRYQHLSHAAEDMRAVLNGEVPRASSNPLPPPKINFEGGPVRRAGAGRRSSKGLPAAPSAPTSKGGKKDRRGARPPRTDRYPGTRAGAGPVAWGISALVLVGAVAAAALYLARNEARPDARVDGKAAETAAVPKGTGEADGTSEPQTAAAPAEASQSQPPGDTPGKQPGPEPPWVNLFDGATLRGWQVDDPAWLIKDGWMVGLGKDRNAVMRLKTPLPKAFELFFEVKTESNCHLGWTDPATGILGVLHIATDSIALERYANGKASYHRRAKMPASTEARTVLVRAEGATVHVYISGEKVVTNPNMHAPGQPPLLSVYARPKGSTSFRNWKVRARAGGATPQVPTEENNPGQWTAMYDGRSLSGFKVLDPEWTEGQGEIVGRYAKANARLMSERVIPPTGGCRFSAAWQGEFNIGFYGAKQDVPVYLTVLRGGVVTLSLYTTKGHVELGRAQVAEDGKPRLFYVGFAGRNLSVWIDSQCVIKSNAGSTYNPCVRYGVFHVQKNSVLRISSMEYR